MPTKSFAEPTILIECVGLIPCDAVVNPLCDKLVRSVAQDWMAARLLLWNHPFHASLLSVTTTINHAGGTRVSVLGLRLTFNGVEAAGSLHV